MKNTIKSNTYIIFCAGVSITAHAQVAPDAGTILREQQKPAIELPTRPAPEIKLDEPVRPAIKPSEARFVLTAFRVSGNTVFSSGELLALVQDYVGKSVGFADLETAAARVSRYYRERGYTVARAYLPAQDIKDGVVEIAVIEGRFGRSEINNRSRLRDGIARSYLDGLPGAAVYSPQLERKLLLLNDLAGVGTARATLRPGVRVGETDVVVDLSESPWLNGSLEYDNYGNRFTGANRLTGQFNLLSPLGLGDQLSIRATKGFDGLEYVRVNYLLPVGSDGFKLGGAYSASHYKLGGLFAAQEASGNSHNYTLNASYPFVRSRNVNVYGQLAYDWRDFQDRLLGGITVNDKKTRVASATLSGDVRDAFFGGGITVYSIAYNLGQVDIETPAQRVADDASARSNGHFDKWNVNLIRLQGLSENTMLYVSFAGQKAGKNLDTSEKFILGGPNGVRAYPQGEGTGDTGYVATAELRYSVNMRMLPGTLQPFVFIDAGEIRINENPFAAGANRRHLAGGGLGVNWARTQDFQVKLSLATRIGTQPATSDTDRHTRGWVQAIKYF